MIDVFLSAGVPLPERNRIFFDTADVLAIRESIKSLVEVVLPSGRITCGGHPAITPLLALFVKQADLKADRVTIFQSQLFKGQLPSELASFVNVRMVDAIGNNRDQSLTSMRRQMISSKNFHGGVFIGGMEGLYEEKDIFISNHPNAVVLPLATTGAAAAIIHKNGGYDPDLARNRTYSSLFRRKLMLNRP